MSPIVGIDLGTTNSLVAVFRDGRPQLIPNVHGELLTPSVVGALATGQVIVGSTARDLRVTEPQRCAATFKRLMGQNRSIRLGERSFTAPELSAMVLRSLKSDAEVFLGESVSEAVITVPAYFNDHQRKATRLAGELAGLKVRRIINEPTAAALAYGFHDRTARKKVLVIDLGGGTFDVTLMEVSDGVMEIISTAGENFLGGEDFTDRIAAAVLMSQKLQFEVVEQRHPLKISRLREECERAKREISSSELAVIRIPDDNGNLSSEAVEYSLTREEFLKMARPLLDRLRAPIGKALRDGRCKTEEVDEIILAGGATRMPVIRELVIEDFKKEPSCSLNPDEVVAMGAAVQAALIVDDSAVDDVVMTDVCPHTLGVEVVRELGGELEQGFFFPVIHRNTTIPVSREERVYTVYPNQTSIALNVYQGEARRIKDNLHLGSLNVKGIPLGPPGRMIVVRFTYDLNGILEVEAFVPGNDKKFQTVLNQDSSGLSAFEIKEALKRMQLIKFYPRDDLENQRLVRFCDRLVGEVSTDDRARLEFAIDNFEHAMQSGDRTFFDNARSLLIDLLQDLGIEFPESDGEENS